MKYKTTHAFFNHWLSKPFMLFCLLAFLGVLGAFSYAPFDFGGSFLCFSLSGFAGLLFRADHWKRALLSAGIYFFFYSLATLYWVGNAFGVVGLGWLSPIAYIGLPLASSLLTTAASVVAWYLSKNSGLLNKTFMLGAALSTTFLLSFFTQFAFPWILPGYALSLNMLQSTAFIGIEGLTWLATFGALFLFTASRIYQAATIILFTVMTFSGMMRLNNESLGTPYNFRLIQPSITQETKWDPEHLQNNLQVQGLLSQLDAEKPVQAVIWPEAAVTFNLEKYPELQKMLGNAAPGGGYVFLGTVRENDGKPHNSFVVLDEHGEKKATYDKKHLVPFGEYIPLRALLPGVNKLTHGARDFVPGELPSVIALPKVPPFRVLICYEAIFSREIMSASDTRPEWLLNLTNDAWYGDSAGPPQHLANVRVRAIEQGLPLVRCANNGISAVIDPYGRIIHRLELNDVGIIDFNLPQALSQTLYAKYGSWIIFILLGINALILSVGYVLRQKK